MILSYKANMIIDVVDLEFKTLRFSKAYDTTRYRKGTQIYNRGNVEVTNVEKIDANNYSIEAEVEGNYDDYTTTLEITGNLIKSSSCTCEDYKKGNLCKHIIATSMEAIDPHYASTEAGRKKLEKKEQEEVKKRLEEIRIKQEEEKRRRLYEIKYQTGISTLSTYKRNTRENIAKTLDLKDIYYQTIEEKNAKPQKLANAIKLEYNIEVGDEETLKISFKIGQTRMYVLNNICKLYEAYKNEEEIYYGKQLAFIPKRENFVEDSQPIFDFIIKYAEMAEYTKKYSRYGLAEEINKAIYLTGKDIDEFLENNKEKTIILNNYKVYGEYKLTDEKLKL